MSKRTRTSWSNNYSVCCFIITRNWTPSGWSVMKKKTLYQCSTYDTDTYKLALISVCKELVVRKKNHIALYYPINNIPQCNGFVLLRGTRQSEKKFNEDVPGSKLVKAKKCLHVLRTLRKEHYSQVEADHLFISVVLPNFSYALSVYGASESDISVIQGFLDRCHERRFISFPVFIKNLLNKQDRNILKKLISTDCHAPAERYHSCPED